jgi:hypothetical protein
LAQLIAPPVHAVPVEVGGMAVLLRTGDADFARMLEDRYVGFAGSSLPPAFEFEVDLVASTGFDPDADVDVRCQQRRWFLRRGDFHAEWDPRSRRGYIRQTANPYSVDAVLRIVHSLVLASEGGFLLHSASAMRNGRAFLFSGVSGAGKTTISRLAPADVTLLTDEVSYVRRQEDGYRAFGTPFAGELARVGENVSAPIAALYLLEKGAENRIERVSISEATERIMRNILFFAEEPELVCRIFDSACEFVARVPVYRLTFFPDERVWELIR